MTAEERNKKERRRASIVVMLRDYPPSYEGPTVTALKAEYLELTGEPYRTAEEEALSISEARREERDAREQEKFDAAMKLISDAKANGFMDCRAVRDALGFDKPKPNGSPYSSMGVAYRWIEDAGEKVVYLQMDGEMYYIAGVRKTISKTLRTGVYGDVFERVKAYKEGWYADLQAREDAINDEAQDMVKAAMAEKKRLIEEREREFTAAQAERERIRQERFAELKAEQDAMIERLTNPPVLTVDERRAAILKGMRTYQGPLNKRGLPKLQPLRRHIEKDGVLGITNDEKKEIWALHLLQGGIEKRTQL